MNNDYSVKIVKVSKELTAKERVALKDLSDAISLGEIKENESIIINPDFSAVLEIHNEHSDTKDYKVFVIVDKNGQRYYTSSESVISSYSNIEDEMCDYPEEEYAVKIYAKPSKNYKGKSFLTCSIV